MKEAAGSASPAADEDRGRQLSPCADTDGTALDEVNDGCSEYHTNTDWCGDYDDADFFSMTMCCAWASVHTLPFLIVASPVTTHALWNST